MADVRGCYQHEPHEPHSWDEEINTAAESRTAYHRCPGVPDDRAPESRPVDILFVDTSQQPVLDDDGNVMTPDRVRDLHDHTVGYTYGTTTGLWWHNECGAYVFDLEAHTNWHLDLDRRIGGR